MSKDGVNLEDEYFKKQEAEQLAKLKAKMDEKKAQQAAHDLKAKHHFRCGKCGTEMNTEVFKGIEIEVCPSCGAVLLDNGEPEHLVGKDQSGGFGVLKDLFRFTKNKDIG